MSALGFSLTGRQLDYGQAVRAGFPSNPRPGQIVTDASGRTWIWPHAAGQGLSDLGQWAEAIGLGVSFISKLFGGGGPKPDNAARQQLQYQQGVLTGIQQEVDSQSIFQPKYIFLFAVAGLALVMAFRK